MYDSLDAKTFSLKLSLSKDLFFSSTLCMLSVGDHENIIIYLWKFRLKKLQPFANKQFARFICIKWTFLEVLWGRQIELCHNQIEKEILTCLNHKHRQSYDKNNTMEKNSMKKEQESFHDENIQHTRVLTYAIIFSLIVTGTFN